MGDKEGKMAPPLPPPIAPAPAVANAKIGLALSKAFPNNAGYAEAKTAAGCTGNTPVAYWDRFTGGVKCRKKPRRKRCYRRKPGPKRCYRKKRACKR